MPLGGVIELAELDHGRPPILHSYGESRHEEDEGRQTDRRREAGMQAGETSTAGR